MLVSRVDKSATKLSAQRGMTRDVATCEPQVRPANRRSDRDAALTTASVAVDESTVVVATTNGQRCYEVVGFEDLTSTDDAIHSHCHTVMDQTVVGGALRPVSTFF